MPTPLLPARAGEPDPWEQALMAFLAEKLRRSGSQRTAEGYSRMLFPFFSRLGKGPDQVTPPEVMGWAHGIGLSGRTPSSTTIGARDRLPLLLLPLPAPDGPRRFQSLRRARTPEEHHRPGT